jgi:hypothetical protein
LIRVKIVICQLFLQAAFFQKIIDSAALTEVGLCQFHRRLRLIAIASAEIVVYIQVFFSVAHVSTPGSECPSRTL